MIYFDNASSTRPTDECLEAFLSASKDNFYNPSSIHAPAMKLFNDINRIKENFLKQLKLDNSYEVIFTSGASESNNLAIIGYALKNPLSRTIRKKYKVSYNKADTFKNSINTGS